MDKRDTRQRLLILVGKDPPVDQRLSPRMDRREAMNAIAASGAKVRHDSGGRIIIVEVSARAAKDLAKRLPGAKLVPVDADVSKLVPDLDPTELLFTEALKIRTSNEYREAKEKRVVGDTPEEQDLVSASCVREEY